MLMKSQITRKARIGNRPLLVVSRGKSLAVVALLLGLVLNAAADELVKNPPATNSGAIIDPEPTEGDHPLGAGCTVAFTRGARLGPPCAVICTTIKAKAQAACDALGENSFGVIDKDWNPIEADDPNADCTVIKGAAGDPNTTGLFFPNGHHMCKGVKGEPHLKSFDGLRYDLQSAGEFIFAKSLDDGFEVQGRLEPYGSHKNISVVTAVAMNVAPYRVVINVRDAQPLRVDGVVFDLADGDTLTLPDADALIIHQGRRYSVVLRDNTNVTVDLFGQGHLSFYTLLAEARDGRMIGIGGNADGDTTNDLVTATGQKFETPPAYEAVHGPFADSWRVAMDNTLFDYAPGETVKTFAILDFPDESLRLEDLDIKVRTRAEAKCRESGITNAVLLNECIFDFAVTGDDIFIEAARSQQSEFISLSANGLPQLFAPERAFAAHKVKVIINGPVIRGYWLGFAPKGSANSGQASNPYSATVLKGNETEVELVVPTEPGAYELRYRQTGRDTEVAVSQPLQSIAPECEISAPDTAQAGGSIEVTLTGDIGESMLVAVVKSDSEVQAEGPSFRGLKSGQNFTGVIRFLPETPGNYEIRCVSKYHNGKTVFARRSLTIQ